MSNTDDFYDDLFSTLPSFEEIYSEIYRCVMTYGEWPVSKEELERLNNPPERFTSMICLRCMGGKDLEHIKEHRAEGPPWIPTAEDLEEADRLLRKKQDGSS